MLSDRSFQILGPLNTKLQPECFTCPVKSRKVKLPVRLTMFGDVGATAPRQVRSKITLGLDVNKFIDQCSSFEHTVVLNRHPVESL